MAHRGLWFYGSAESPSPRAQSQRSRFASTGGAPVGHLHTLQVGSTPLHVIWCRALCAVLDLLLCDRQRLPLPMKNLATR
jgi:hypothetical protein